MRRFMVLIVMLLLVLPASAAQAQPSGPSVSVLNTEPLKVSGEKGKNTVEAKLSVLNTGGGEAHLNVTFQASSNEGVTVRSVSPETLPADEARKLTVTLAGVADLQEAATGQLVIKGGETPIAQTVEVDPAPPDTSWPAYIIGGSLVLAILVALSVVGSLGSKRGRLANAAPNPKWEFTSWATTLTALGAAFGTVLGSATFPEFPENISSAELVNLNILFGVLVLIGPFLFEALRGYDFQQNPPRTEWTGTNRTMLIASSFTLWAVLGQMGAFGLLGWELLGGRGFAYVVAIATVVFILLACWYFFATMSEQVQRNWMQEAQAVAEETDELPESPDSWSLL